MERGGIRPITRMKNPAICRFLPIVLLCVLPASCTIVDTGSAVNNVGREIPVCSDSARVGKHHDTCRVYTDCDGKRYAKLSVCYLPARAKWFHCFQVGGCPVEIGERYYRPGIVAPVEKRVFYAELNPSARGGANKLIPASEFDSASCTCRLESIPLYYQQYMVSAHLPEHCTTLHDAVQPVRWVAEVVDVPLSVLATPVNWLLMMGGYNLWEL